MAIAIGAATYVGTVATTRKATSKDVGFPPTGVTGHAPTAARPAAQASSVGHDLSWPGDRK